MKNLWVLLLIILFGYTSSAQKTNLVFYTEQGETFYLYLNGIQQNTEPQSNMMITDLPDPSYKVRIQFDDPNLGEINKNLMFGQGTETTYVIRMNNNNEWVIRYVKEVQAAQAPAPPEDRSVFVYTAHPHSTQTKVSRNTTTTATTSSSMISTSTATTVTEPEPVAVIEEPEAAALPGYSGPTGCQWPMADKDFNSVSSSISSKNFEDSKLTIAKQVAGSNCLLCSQVKEIMLLFSFEDTRLEFAKFAYQHTYDIGNYYQLNDAFTFESTIDELNEYLRGNSH